MLLESVSTVGENKMERPFPTTRHDYREGQVVSWEWRDRSYPEAWYRDPRDGEIKYGWTSSSEFAGRPIEDV